MKTSRLSKPRTILSYIILCIAITSSPALSKPKGKPVHFDGQGTIDAINITTGYISINDIPFHFAPKPLFYTSARRPIPSNTFNSGHHVAYILDAQQRIKLLWLMKKG